MSTDDHESSHRGPDPTCVTSATDAHHLLDSHSIPVAADTHTPLSYKSARPRRLSVKPKRLQV
jgi:hypothetical protein